MDQHNDIDFIPLETIGTDGRRHTSMLLVDKLTGVSIEERTPSGRLEDVDHPEGPVAFLRAKVNAYLAKSRERHAKQRRW